MWRPVLAASGESDQIAPLASGQAYAGSLPNGRFELTPEAGHLPQIEQPDETTDRIRRFASNAASVL